MALLLQTLDIQVTVVLVQSAEKLGTAAHMWILRPGPRNKSRGVRGMTVFLLSLLISQLLARRAQSPQQRWYSNIYLCIFMTSPLLVFSLPRLQVVTLFFLCQTVKCINLSFQLLSISIQNVGGG